MLLLKSVDALLEHIKSVQADAIDMSKESMGKLGDFLEHNGIDINDDVGRALQYQDIISQQLNATIDAIESVQQSIAMFNHAFSHDEEIAMKSMEKLQDKLDKALNGARDRREAFSGNADKEDDHDVEFF